MNKSEIITIMICFHFNSYRNFQHYYKLIPIYDRLLLRKRSVIETINDELKNVAQLVHSRHRSVLNFAMNVLSAMAAYSFFEKKPEVNLDFCIEQHNSQLSLF